MHASSFMLHQLRKLLSFCLYLHVQQRTALVIFCLTDHLICMKGNLLFFPAGFSCSSSPSAGMVAESAKVDRAHAGTFERSDSSKAATADGNCSKQTSNPTSRQNSARSTSATLLSPYFSGSSNARVGRSGSSGGKRHPRIGDLPR